MTRISDLPTLVSAPTQESFEERIAVLKREIVEAMDPTSDSDDRWENAVTADHPAAYAAN